MIKKSITIFLVLTAFFSISLITIKSFQTIEFNVVDNNIDHKSDESIVKVDIEKENIDKLNETLSEQNKIVQDLKEKTQEENFACPIGYSFENGKCISQEEIEAKRIINEPDFTAPSINTNTGVNDMSQGFSSLQGSINEMVNGPFIKIMSLFLLIFGFFAFVKTQQFSILFMNLVVVMALNFFPVLF